MLLLMDTLMLLLMDTRLGCMGCMGCMVVVTMVVAMVMGTDETSPLLLGNLGKRPHPILCRWHWQAPPFHPTLPPLTPSPPFSRPLHRRWFRYSHCPYPLWLG